MSREQIIILSVIFAMVFGAVWLIWLGTRTPRAKRYSSVARAPTPPGQFIHGNFEALVAEGIAHRDSVVDSYYHDGKIDKLLAQGRTGADFIKVQQPQPEPAPEWIRGMHGPKGRILSKAQFDSLTSDERAYYHAKYLNNHGWPKVGE